VTRNQAILDYMISEGSEKFSKSIAAFREEGNVELGPESSRGILEKKWTAVIRLQKKVLINSVRSIPFIAVVGAGTRSESECPR
jgi:hypothetical protein